MRACEDGSPAASIDVRHDVKAQQLPRRTLFSFPSAFAQEGEDAVACCTFPLGCDWSQGSSTGTCSPKSSSDHSTTQIVSEKGVVASGDSRKLCMLCFCRFPLCFGESCIYRYIFCIHASKSSADNFVKREIWSSAVVLVEKIIFKSLLEPQTT